MLNMLNQFYKYISEMLINQLSSYTNAGDRYYLQLDDTQYVRGLVEEMKNLEGAEEFIYNHESGASYKTFAINLENVKLVVSSTSDGVTPDFLVTLRNAVGEQRDEWEGTALLSIVSEQLDSIEGGSSNLQKEGMPLHPQTLYRFLSNEINNSAMKRADKTILQENLDRLLDDQFLQQVSLLDFKDIFTTLEKEKIEEEDFIKFGMFKDYELENKSGKELKKRLEENHNLFERVQRAHEFSDSVEEELEKKFSSKGVQELKKENWEDVPFSLVYNSMEEKEREDKEAKVYLSRFDVPGLTYWDRPQKESTAGQRKRQIIIFNNEQRSHVDLNARFEISGKTIKSLSDEYVKVQKQFQKYVTTSTGQKNMKISIETEPEQVTFARVNYKHENNNSLGAEFHIVIVPFSEKYLQYIKTNYMINPSKKRIELINEVEELKIGEGLFESTVEVVSANQKVGVKEEDSIILLPQIDAFNDKDELPVNISIEEKESFELVLKNFSPEATPIRASRIWRMKRELETDFYFEGNKLTIGNREFYTHAEYSELLGWEKEWVSNGYMYAQLNADQMEGAELNIEDTLSKVYSDFLNYFYERNITPTLAYVSKEYKKVAISYVEAYKEAIKQLKENSGAEKRRNLVRLGILKGHNGLYLTPFHPLMVAYQIQVSEKLGNQEIDPSILERLNPNGLLPYFYDNLGEIYKPDIDSSIKEWLGYSPVNEVSVSDATSYLAKVVEDKLKQFEEHFTYLFVEGARAPIKVNVINITNDREVVRGLLTWLKEQISKKGPEHTNLIEVSLYFDEKQDSALDLFSRLQTPDEVYQEFNVKLSSDKYDEYDILRFLRDSLHYYKFKLEDDLRYAHLSFYKMKGKENFAIRPMEEMKTGVSLDGLLSSVPSMRDEDTYKSGFGLKGYENIDDLPLLDVAKLTNELTANNANEGYNAYSPEQAVMSRTTTDDEATLSRIFESSFWVTFVDPSMGLEYFQSYKNLVIIHYNDQYSSSTRYDAITVTEKAAQYNNSIKEFLKKHEIEASEDEIKQVIKAFNSFNGEWLLRIIGSKGYFDREKLSIISAIKYALIYFDHPNITWVPVSLEEVLRVAGAVGLNKKNGVFTAKNLGVTGAHSDDLLLIGVENVNNNIKLHFYPVEVKIGQNSRSVIEKAKEQISKTRELFETYLNNDGSDESKFNREFYRQFFVQLLLANAEKFIQSELWNEKNYEISDHVKYQLLSDQFEVSRDLIPFIGKGAIVSFEKDRVVRTVEQDEEGTLLNLTERDGYEGLIEPVESYRKQVVEGKTDFQTDPLLINRYHVNRDDSTPDPTSNHSPSRKESSEVSRILIGEAEGSKQKIYWEYGHSQLANRHLLISGKSGQGKTYFMQCLLMEQALQGTSSIIIDYTEGFLPNQLEEEFMEQLGDKLNQTIVYTNEFPINPFKKNSRNIGEIDLEENETDIAERIKSVFSAVYSSLGVQQLNAIYEATKNGVVKHGNQMSLTLLKEELQELGSTYAQKTLSQISNLIDRDPFAVTKEEVDWKNIIESDGTVNVIQLTGYPRDVQLMITEFILWDLWNFSVQHGNKSIPIPVVMDEAQNLDHREHSPSARILTEGRKFGWSGWYATQFLKSQLDADELARLQNSSQKVYFAPPEQEVGTIAASLAKDKFERREWETKLAGLKKGQCIIHGPIQQEDGNLTNPITEVVNITPLNQR